MTVSFESGCSLSPRWLTITFWFTLAAAALHGTARGQTSPADHFEKRVRPIFARHCVECHHGAEAKGGLALDSAAGFQKGAETGAVFQADNPSASRLIEVLRHDGDIRMPPQQKLADHEIEAIVAWLAEGAPWPEVGTPASAVRIPEEIWKNHWAFRSLVAVTPKTTPESEEPSDFIDAFISERLAAAGIVPSPAADRLTQIRRATFDLIGLPPTPEEIDAFLEDDDAGAFERLVDRLLASPQYGVKWARHWLDVARYADSRGYLPGEADTRIPFAWTYRDWVVNSLNADLTYDQFLIEQIAADHVPRGEGSVDNRHLAALGFLTLTPGFLNGEPDEIDDRLDVLTRGTMALTVTCARCHDHKYDPVPSADYYSLYGVFAGTSITEIPLIASRRDQQRLESFQAEQARRAGPRNALLQKRLDLLLDEVRPRVRDAVIAAGRAFAPAPAETPPDTPEGAPGEAPPESAGDSAAELPPEEVTEAGAPSETDSPQSVAPSDESTLEIDVQLQNAAVAGEVATEEETQAEPQADAETVPTEAAPVRQEFIDRFINYIRSQDDGAGHHRVFGPWHQFAAIPQDQFAEQAGALAAKFAANDQPLDLLNERVAALFTTAPEGFSEVVERYADLFQAIEQEWLEFRTQVADQPEPPQGLADPEAEELRLQLENESSLLGMPLEEFRVQLFDATADDEIKQAVRGLEEWIADCRNSPQAPPHAVALQDPAVPVEPQIFRGGDPGNTGETVPRQFLEFLAGRGREPFRVATGRLELARAIASADNPLTPRVIVNRIWMQHFGEGLVRTPSDFGLRSEPPTHPELLDFLSHRFVSDGWSLKKLHRWILLSDTWQRSATDNAQGRRIDPENRLYWRANRRRLPFESLRDTLLAVAGRLDQTLGGPAVDLFTEPFSLRRSLYARIDRGNLNGTLRTFDFPNPRLHNPQRDETLVPQQALFLWNSAFAAEQSRAMAARLEKVRDTTSRLHLAWRLVYGRAPSPGELHVARLFLERAAELGEQGPETVVGPWRYGVGAVDARTLRVTTFQPLTVFLDDHWQAGIQMPDPIRGWVFLSENGGHPGADGQSAAIRRFVVPAAGSLSITGTFSHPAEAEGNGVRGRIVSSRRGVLGNWNCCREEFETTVAALVHENEIVDFVVDSREDEGNDAFTWTVRVGLTSAAMGVETVWDSRADFVVPVPEPSAPLTPWQKLAQVLLMSNEFAYVD